MMNDLFDVTGKVAVVTGGYSVLGGSIARGLAAAGARVAILGTGTAPESRWNRSWKNVAKRKQILTVVADVTNSQHMNTPHAKYDEKSSLSSGDPGLS